MTFTTGCSSSKGWLRRFRIFEARRNHGFSLGSDGRVRPSLVARGARQFHHRRRTMAESIEKKFSFEHTERIRWVDLDAAGVLNNAVYLTLVEQARFAFFTDLGLIEGAQFPFLLGDTHVRYLLPGKAGETVTIRTGVSRVGTKSFDMIYEVDSGRGVLARAEATLIWVDSELRSIAIPDAARALIAPS